MHSFSYFHRFTATSCAIVVFRGRLPFGADPSPTLLGVYFMSVYRSRLLAAFAATTALVGLSVTGVPTAQASPHRSGTSDTPKRLTPKGEIADELAGKDEL